MIDVNVKMVRKLAELQCTQAEAAAFFGITVGRFARLLKQYPALKYAWQHGLEVGKISLRRLQWAHAVKNPAMAIHLGKNILGQSDKVKNELSGEDGGPIEVEFIGSKEDKASEVD
jgi:hypothetical protein